MRKFFLFVFSFILCILLGGCGNTGELSQEEIDPEIIENYSIAQAYFDNEDFVKAEEFFALCGEYENSAEMVLESQYMRAGQLLKAKKYADAKNIFYKLGSYKDSVVKMEEVDFQRKYDAAVNALSAKDYNTAYQNFSAIPEYLDSQYYLERFSAKTVIIGLSYSQKDNLGNNFTYREKYEYDEQGRLWYVIAESGNLLNESQLIHAWTYNPLHLCTINAEIYEYGDMGQVMTITGLSGAWEQAAGYNPRIVGTSSYIITFTYDEEGRAIQENIVTNTDQGILTLSYGDKGLLTTTQWDKNVSPSLYFYYDEHENISRVVNTDDLWCEYIFTYVYDEEGNIIKTDTSKSIGPSYTETFSFNKEGNIDLIVREFEKDAQPPITIRPIYKTMYVYS